MMLTLKAQLEGDPQRWKLVTEEWGPDHGERVVPSDLRREAFQQAVLVLLVDMANTNRDILGKLPWSG
jgi:hypothetical protein